MATHSPPNEDQGPMILWVTVVMTILASVLSLAPRLYVRLKVLRNIGWDDYMMCIASILSIATMIIIILEVQKGGGRHRQYIDPEDFKTGLYLNFLTQPLYVLVSTFVKESVGFFLIRIAGKGKYRVMIIIIMTALAMWTISGMVVLTTQCKDMRAMWDPKVKRNCWPTSTILAMSYINGFINILTDFAFAILIPVPLLYRLQMNGRKKWTLLAILAMGLFACSAGIIRTVYLRNLGKKGDFLWDSSPLTIWFAVESQVGVLAGNLPALKPLCRRILESTDSWSRTARDQSTQNYGRSHIRTGPKAMNASHVEEIDLGLFDGSKGRLESDAVAIGSSGSSEVDMLGRLSEESSSRLHRGAGGLVVPETGILRSTKVKVSYDLRK